MPSRPIFNAYGQLVAFVDGRDISIPRSAEASPGSAVREQGGGVPPDIAGLRSFQNEPQIKCGVCHGME